jgi:hypothetical protein
MHTGESCAAILQAMFSTEACERLLLNSDTPLQPFCLILKFFVYVAYALHAYDSTTSRAYTLTSTSSH